MNFSEAARNHLSVYKKEELGVYENGVWKRHDRPYPHILPPELWSYNLLENYRQDMISHIEAMNLQLHHDFHHLNSSQALCLNFFYPIMAEKITDLFLQLLQLDVETVENWSFDKVFFPAEGTSFDFYLRFDSGRELYFVVKYSESEFGKVKSIGKYRRKYEEFHKERLQGKIRPELDEYEAYLHHYRLLRNISYVDVNKDHLFIVIYPQKNISLMEEFHHFLDRVIVPELHDKVRFITWESMVSGLNERLLTTNAPLRLLHHYTQFEDKYLL